MKRLAAVAFAVLVAACSRDTAETASETTATQATATETGAPAATQAETAPPAAASAAGADTFAIPANLQTTPSGLQYSIDRPGTGPQPQPGQIVSVHYTGWLTDGTKFDSSRDRNEPIEFPLGQGRVIRGWDEGIGLMKVGEKRTLVIPPQLGYGPGGRGPIPPNATMVFAVELVGVR